MTPSFYELKNIGSELKQRSKFKQSQFPDKLECNASCMSKNIFVSFRWIVFKEKTK